MTEQEFAEIIDSTKRTVLSAIQTHLADRFYHAIDDVAQETYIRAYRSLVKKKFKEESLISTWLYTIAKNESLRMNKKMSREEMKFEKSVEKMKTVAAYRTEEHNHDIELLREAIGNLPEKYRPVLELVSRGLTEKQISEKLEIKIGTVKSRSSRGREMLEKLLKGGA
jgi:RNA polymerase sigma-70 factor (ECF subfamily)